MSSDVMKSEAMSSDATSSEVKIIRRDKSILNLFNFNGQNLWNPSNPFNP